MTLSAAERSSDRNWRSVAFSAASGILLIRPMSMHFGSDSRNSAREFPYRRRPLANIMETTDCRPIGVMASLGGGSHASELHTELRAQNCAYLVPFLGTRRSSRVRSRVMRSEPQTVKIFVTLV